MDLCSKSVNGSNLTFHKQVESQNYFGLNQTAEFQINFGINFSLKYKSYGSKELVKERKWFNSPLKDLMISLGAKLWALLVMGESQADLLRLTEGIQTDPYCNVVKCFKH